MSDNDEYQNRLEDLHEQRYRALGTRTPHCAVPGCTETDPLALTGTHPQIRCQEHLADRDGRSWTQQHHLSGRANSPETVPLPANDHAVVSGFQSLWDRDTLRNPDRSPLRRAAAAIRAWMDILVLIIERTVGWVPALLESLDDYLRGVLGPEWWEQWESQR
jgi:hypothetical protein